MRPMRRARLEVREISTLERWLREAPVGRLATVDEDGYPLIKPVNFVYVDGKVFFHSATQGEKVDDIRRDPRVGFEIDHLYDIVAPIDQRCQTHCFYHSIIIRGNARVLDRAEDQAKKEHILRLLVNKYAPAFPEAPLTGADKTAVVEIAIERITGKQDPGGESPPPTETGDKQAVL